MIIVENGKIVDFCGEPGGYIYNTGTEPSLFDSSGNLLAGAAFSVQEENGMYLNQDGSRSEKVTEHSLWKTNKNGQLKVKSLDSGTYRITEEQAPDGYLPVDPFEIEICADYQDPQAVVLVAEGTGVQFVDAKSGNIKIQIADRPVPPAPKTGDTNWTVFYLMLLGGSLFLLAAVLVSVKIRKGNRK